MYSSPGVPTAYFAFQEIEAFLVLSPRVYVKQLPSFKR